MVPESALKMMQARTMTYDEQVGVYHSAARNWNGERDGLVQVVPTAGTPLACTDRLLETIIDLAEQYDTVTTSHVLEHPQRPTGGGRHVEEAAAAASRRCRLPG